MWAWWADEGPLSFCHRSMGKKLSIFTILKPNVKHLESLFNFLGIHVYCNQLKFSVGLLIVTGSRPYVGYTFNGSSLCSIPFKNDLFDTSVESRNELKQYT